MYTTILEAIVFAIFSVLAIVLLVAFVDALCSYMPYACSLELVKQAIALLFKIMWLFLAGAIIYFIVALILEYYEKKSSFRI
ncbi:MAG: hypothetical protein CBR30_09785 [Dictyoglomus sp. NZ13-RE01]|nr:MAG: hypothetical protein CBR30_09785 [Dictyoglomus sp. NZ13-RE01]